MNDKDIKNKEPIESLRDFIWNPETIPSDPKVREQMFAVLEESGPLPFGDLVELAGMIMATPEEERESDMMACLCIVTMVELGWKGEAYARAVAAARTTAAEGDEPALPLLLAVLRGEKTVLSATETEAVDTLLGILSMADLKTTMDNLKDFPEEMTEVLAELWGEMGTD